MASKKTVTLDNLVALGPERLAAILVELADDDAEIKRRLRLELAAQAGDDTIATEISKRLTALRSAGTGPAAGRRSASNSRAIAPETPVRSRPHAAGLSHRDDFPGNAPRPRKAPRRGSESHPCARERSDRLRSTALSRCRAASAKCRCLRNCQAAATAVRHVVIAAARSTRCVWAEVRWRWMLKVLWTAACVERNFWAEPGLLNRCILRSRRRVG